MANEFDACGQRRFTDEPIAPELVEQLLFAHDIATPLHQVRENIEGLGLELHLLAVAPKDDARQVELAIRKSENHARLFLRVPPTCVSYISLTDLTHAGCIWDSAGMTSRS